MAVSETYTDVAGYQAYEQQFRFDLITDMFIKPKTMSMVTVHEGVKGRLTLTRLLVNDLARRYSHAFAATANQVEFVPRTLEVVDAKVEYSVVPKEYENSYLAELRRRGQDPMDWPVQAMVLSQIIAKLKAEIELALWNGVKNPTPTATDKLNQLFDGYVELVRKAITATDVTPEATGAITSTNAVASVEAVLSNISNAYADMELDIFMSRKGRRNYFIDYRERYGKYTQEMGADGSFKIDAENAYIHSIAGMPDDGIIITPRTNLHAGIDAASDSEFINFQQMHRQLDMWIDFKIGTQIAKNEDGVLAVNDQL